MDKPEPGPGEGVKDVRFTEDTMAVDLPDGRTIVVPLAWCPRLLEASPAQRHNWKPSGAGFGIHWPDIDADLTTEGLLRGAKPVEIARQRTRTQENLLALYLRLNGFFLSGFIVHSDVPGANITEVDALAVRFPYNAEPEREIGPDPLLELSKEHTEVAMRGEESRSKTPVQPCPPRSPSCCRERPALGRPV